MERVAFPPKLAERLISTNEKSSALQIIEVGYKMKMALVLYYNKLNRNSFNALVGAIETNTHLSDLKIFFFTNHDKLIFELESIINEYRLVVVGISFATTQLWDTYELVRSIKKNYSDKVILVAGGPHPTGDPHGTLKMGFNIVVVGEGEETINELLIKISNSEDYNDIKGVAFFEEGQYHYSGRRPWIDLNRYSPFGIKYNKFGPIEITRGCPYVCYFCQTPHLLGIKPRHRSVENICTYVQIMKERNLIDFRCITPNAFSYGSSDGKQINIQILEDLLSNLKKILYPDGRIFFGTFPSEVRPEHVTPETIGLILKYADNDNLIIGAQTGSQRMLDYCHRGHTIDDIFNAVELTLTAGLIANVDFIFGLPHETKEDIWLTLNYMEKLSYMGAKIHAHTFIPLPQTPWSKSKAGRVGENIKNLIKQLNKDGKKIVYGDWGEQARIGKKISDYLRSGEL